MTHLGGITTAVAGQADKQIVDTQWFADFSLDELPKRFATGSFKYFGQRPAVAQAMVLLDMARLTGGCDAGNRRRDGVVVGIGHR